jgi:hypothetical protein
MTENQQTALTTARKHAQAIAAQLKRARAAHADGDAATVQRCHRAAAASCDALDAAHDSLGRALVLADDYVEPTHGPQAGSQAEDSHSGPPRSYAPEEIRSRDQRTSVEAAYHRRMAEEGRRR